MSTNKFISLICILIIVVVLTIKYEANKRIRHNLQKMDVPKTQNRQLTHRIEDITDDILITDEGKTFEKPKPVEKHIAIIKPYITAEAYIVANLDTGEVYLNLNENKIFPIASVSKLYTALVVSHLMDPKKEIVINEKMLDAVGDSAQLKLGEKLTVEELLYALLLVSSNDTAVAYAESYGYNDFIEEMNAFAMEIGMKSTSFRDPSGLTPLNVSNVSDLFYMAKYLYTSEKDILEITRTGVMDIATTTDHNSHHFVNINPYYNYLDFIGGKTGRTEEAKESMVSLFNQKIKTNNGDEKTYPIAVIVLRSDLGEREINTEKLLGLFMDKVGDVR